MADSKQQSASGAFNPFKAPSTVPQTQRLLPISQDFQESFADQQKQIFDEVTNPQGDNHRSRRKTTGGQAAARTQQTSPSSHMPQIVQRDINKLADYIMFDDPRLARLESSPYRQKLYFKKKGVSAIGQHGRAPSVNPQSNDGQMFQKVSFPPAEYFNNIKAQQMRMTQQQSAFNTHQPQATQLPMTAGTFNQIQPSTAETSGIQTQGLTQPRSNSILVKRGKQLNQQSLQLVDANSIIPQSDQSKTVPQSDTIFPKTIKQQQAPSTFLQSQESSNQISASTTPQQQPQMFQINTDLSDYVQSSQPKLTSRGVRYYNRVVEQFQNKFYQKKTRPSSLQKRVEIIYDENIQLKHQLNQLQSQSTLQKTQNRLLNNELEKQNNLMAQILGQASKSLQKAAADGPHPMVVIEQTSIKQTELVGNLKRQLDIALKELAEKEQEIKTIQKQSKVTKYKELEEECKTYMNECFRLHKTLKKFLLQSGLALNPQALQESHSNLDITADEGIEPKHNEFTEQNGFLKHQNNKIKTELEALQKRYDIQYQQLKQANETNKSLKDQFASQQHHQTLQEQPNQLPLSQNSTPLSQNNLCQEDLDSLQLSLDQLKSDNNSLQLQVQDQSTEIQALKNSLQEQIQSSQDQQLSFQEQIQLKDQEIFEKAEQIQGLQVENQELKQEIKSKDLIIGELTKQIEELRLEDVTKDNNENKHEEDYEALKNQMQDLERQIHEREKEFTEMKGIIEVKENEIQRKAQMINELENKQNNQEESSALQAQVKEKEGLIEGLKLEIQQLIEEIEQTKEDRSNEEKDKLIQELTSQIESLKLQLESQSKEIIIQPSESPTTVHPAQEFPEPIDPKLQEQVIKLLSELQTTKDGAKLKDDIIAHLQFLLKDLQSSDKVQFEETNAASDQLVLPSQRDIQNQISNITQDVYYQTSELVELRDTISKLQDQYSDLQQRHEDALQDNETSFKELLELRSQLDTDNFTIQKLQSNVKDLTTQLTDATSQITELTAQIQELQTKKEDLKYQLEQLTSAQQDDDQDLMSKLQALMVSLQLKEREMKDQANAIEDMKLQAEQKELEYSEQIQDLSLKQAEVTTLKSYFEKSEEKCEALQKVIDEQKKEKIKHQEEIAACKEEISRLQEESKQAGNQTKDLDCLREEIENLKKEFETERLKHLEDIEKRFRRCLEILQIHDAKGLTNFLKTNVNEKNSDEDLEEFLAMKFNMTKAESGLFLQKVLQIQGNTSKTQLIDQFITKMGKDVQIIDKEKVSKAYQELVEIIIEQYKSIEDFLLEKNFAKSQIMHYYLVEKTLTQLYQKKKETAKDFQFETNLHMIVTHLLNQSRNFYQIESRIVRDNLLKHFASKKPTEGKDSSWDQPQVDSASKKGEASNEYEDEYEDEVDEEEKQLLDAEQTERARSFNNAMQKLKTGIKDEGMVIKLKQEKIAEAQKPAQKKPQGKCPAQLQQLANYLVGKKMNLRQFLKIYHIGRAELPFSNEELEALSFDEFISFIRQQNIYSSDDLAKYAPFSSKPLEEAFETVLGSMQCIHQIQKTNLRVIELRKLLDCIEQCGYQDYLKPKARKNFDFSTLDVKSIRILNRLTQFVYKNIERFIIQNKIPGQLSNEQQRTLQQQIMQNMFSDVLKKVLVQAANREERVYLIQKEDFFTKLKQFGIRKSPGSYENLVEFLKVDSQYSHLILFKKLVKTVEIFNVNNLFKSVGTKRVNLLQSSLTAPKVTYKQDPKPVDQPALEQSQSQEKEATEYEYGYEYGSEYEESPAPSQSPNKGANQMQRIPSFMSPQPPQPISSNPNNMFQNSLPGSSNMLRLPGAPQQFANFNSPMMLPGAPMKSLAGMNQQQQMQPIKQPIQQNQSVSPKKNAVSSPKKTENNNDEDEYYDYYEEV